jgi:hypothetical protein
MIQVQRRTEVPFQLDYRLFDVARACWTPSYTPLLAVFFMMKPLWREAFVSVSCLLSVVCKRSRNELNCKPYPAKLSTTIGYKRAQRALKCLHRPTCCFSVGLIEQDSTAACWLIRTNGIGKSQLNWISTNNKRCVASDCLPCHRCKWPHHKEGCQQWSWISWLSNR